MSGRCGPRPGEDWLVGDCGGDRNTIKVHIHTDNPAIPLDYAIRSGAALDDVVVENMELQYRRRLTSDPKGRSTIDADSAAIAVLAVAEGAGLRAVFCGLNCSKVIAGGAGRNPSTEDFIDSIASLPAYQVIILPNNRNIVLAAQQAADLIPNRNVQVVATETVLQGIGAMLAWGDAMDGDADLETAVAHMRAASDDIRSIEITQASRASQVRDLEINQGDYIAIVDGEIRAASRDVETVIMEAFSSLGAGDVEVATVYYGVDVSAVESERLIRRLREAIKDLDFESIYGGQPLYPFLISVE